MKLLLTSAGITNASIHDALVDLLGKPIAESNALCIPTATYAMPGGAGHAWRLISGRRPGSPMCELGWKSLGVLELTALPSIDEELWVPMVRETDALLVGGGDALYLCYWMRQSGLADLLPSLRREAVYVGLSAGSMVMAQEEAIKMNRDGATWESLIRGGAPTKKTLTICEGSYRWARKQGRSPLVTSCTDSLLLMRFRIEKVVHHRDDDGHALHQRDVCRVGQDGQSRC